MCLFRRGSGRAEAAELVSFFWYRSGGNADRNFTISFGAAFGGAAAGGHYLNCTLHTPGGRFIKLCDIPMTAEQWSELDTALRSISLPAYTPPDPYITDAEDSRADICRARNGVRFTKRYNGEYAHGLYSFLLTFIGRIAGINTD